MRKLSWHLSRSARFLVETDFTESREGATDNQGDANFSKTARKRNVLLTLTCHQMVVDGLNRAGLV